VASLNGAIEQKGTPVDSINPYSVLRLGPAATAEEISRAYRFQLRLHHPDMRPLVHSVEQEEAERSRLQAAMDAYAVLGDPASRSSYDREHRSESPAAVIKPRVQFPRTHHQQVVAGPLKWTPPMGRRS
jgi:DnaJ-class molecular chaperone